MKSCDNPFGCACYEANGYSLTDCEYFVESPFDEESEFECCDDCDLPDACSDFGCAIKQGIKEKPNY